MAATQNRSGCATLIYQPGGRLGQSKIQPATTQAANKSLAHMEADGRGHAAYNSRALAIIRQAYGREKSDSKRSSNTFDEVGCYFCLRSAQQGFNLLLLAPSCIALDV